MGRKRGEGSREGRGEARRGETRRQGEEGRRRQEEEGRGKRVEGREEERAPPSERVLDDTHSPPFFPFPPFFYF